MFVSIIVPTYRRPNDLQRLLDSICQQTVQPEEVFVIIGPGDRESLNVAKAWHPKLPSLQVLQIQKTSMIHAINTVLPMVGGDIICHLDDDVWIPPDYIQKIKRAYESNAKLGAYGGRDHLQLDDPRLANPPLAHLVGTYLWYGRIEGNHHCGVQDSPVRVDFLKGVNLSFRRTAFPAMQIEPALEGIGAEAGWEADVSQCIIVAGYDVVYDNDNYVLHYASPRVDFDDRTDLFLPIVTDRVFNDSLIIAKYRPMIEIITSCLVTFLIGSRFQPGLLWSLLLAPKHHWNVLKLPWRNVGFIWRGTIRGLKLRRGVGFHRRISRIRQDIHQRSASFICI